MQVRLPVSLLRLVSPELVLSLLHFKNGGPAELIVDSLHTIELPYLHFCMHTGDWNRHSTKISIFQPIDRFEVLAYVLLFIK